MTNTSPQMYRLRHTWARRVRALKLLLALPVLYLAFAAAVQAQSESIIPLRHDGQILQDGRLSIHTRFQTNLPPNLQNALKEGVPLDFDLHYRLEKPRLTSYRYRLANWIGGSDQTTVSYRLSFHPLTNRYRVSVGTFSHEYETLEAALKSVGAIANWQVLDPGALSDTDTKHIRVKIRLHLSTAQLPKPFQINAIHAGNWQLDSGWKRLDIRR